MLSTQKSKRATNEIVGFRYLKGDECLIIRANGKKERTSWLRLRSWVQEIYIADHHIKPGQSYLRKGVKDGLPIFVRAP
jgi:hypothetical protein